MKNPFVYLLQKLNQLMFWVLRGINARIFKKAQQTHKNFKRSARAIKGQMADNVPQIALMTRRERKAAKRRIRKLANSKPRATSYVGPFSIYDR